MSLHDQAAEHTKVLIAGHQQRLAQVNHLVTYAEQVLAQLSALGQLSEPEIKFKSTACDLVLLIWSKPKEGFRIEAELTIIPDGCFSYYAAEGIHEFKHHLVRANGSGQLPATLPEHFTDFLLKHFSM